METSERITPENIKSESDYLMYLRHAFAYSMAIKYIHKESFVLDFGCGEGYGTSMLSHHAINVIGLDIDTDSVARATKKYKSKNCTFMHYNGEMLPFKNNTFDVITSFQVIEHMKNEQQYLSEIHSYLKSDGLFILTTPNKALRGSGAAKPWNKYHFKEYTSHELSNILKNHFSRISLLGIRGNEQIQQKEKDRIKKILKMVSLDPLNLRSLIPEFIKQKVIAVLQKNKADRKFMSMYKLEDYQLSINNIDDCLDLLAICEK